MPKLDTVLSAAEEPARVTDIDSDKPLDNSSISVEVPITDGTTADKISSPRRSVSESTPVKTVTKTTVASPTAMPTDGVAASDFPDVPARDAFYVFRAMCRLSMKTMSDMYDMLLYVLQ